MSDAAVEKADGRAARGRPWIAVVCVGALLGGVFWLWSGGHGGSRRVEIPTAYPNARPGVAYVGDVACVECHADIARTYYEHPMGRSLSGPDGRATEAREGGRSLFSFAGFEYAIEGPPQTPTHVEIRRDEQGREIGRVSGLVRYIIGSGTRAKSFVVERGGFLFESPITWYSQKEAYDLSPGYAARNAHFERPVTSDCLFCHANRVVTVPGTINGYAPPVLEGHAIGCERCHGPGELHAAQPVPSPREASNIVNPAKLEPTLREDVCRQCHLMGEATVPGPAGRSFTDYRPGLPLRRFQTVFVRPSHKGTHHNAGHVEQMEASRCFTASQGALGCISCHDPHKLPGAKERVTYYRGRCLTCHEKRPCSLPIEERRKNDRGADCIACHMPRAPVSDIPHLATTIHSIPRRAETVGAETTTPVDERPPVPFGRQGTTAAERAEVRRATGIVLGQEGTRFGAQALPLLREAVAADPRDEAAGESEGFALAALGRTKAAADAFDRVLSFEPERESTLVAAAKLAGLTNRDEEALSLWRRVIAINPHRSDYHAALGRLLVRRGALKEGVSACRTALTLNPANVSARVELIAALKKSGDTAAAGREYETLLQFDPPQPEMLKRWYEALTQ